MAEENKKLERIYTIPLRKFWVRVPEFKRSRKAVIAIKQFIAKHMKVPDRDLSKVKVDIYLNNDIWFKGKASPPSRVKVRAIKEGDIVKVQLAESSQHVNFLKLRHSKIHKKAESLPADASKKEQPKELKTEEQKTDEKEKEKAGEIQGLKEAKQEVKAHKHTTQPKEPKIQRMALKK